MSHSYAQTAELTCPACQQPFTADIWLVIDLAEHPELLPRLQDNSIHATPCPHCQEGGHVDAPLLLYRPTEHPRLLFSPAQQTSTAQDQEHLQGLLGGLHQALGAAWQDNWLNESFTVLNRTQLAALLRGDPLPSPDLDEEGEGLPPQVAALMETIQAFIAQETWLESLAWLNAHPELLEEKTLLLLQFLQEAANQAGQESESRIFAEDLALLQACRQEGVVPAFAAKLNMTPAELEARTQMAQLPANVQAVLAQIAQSGLVINSPEDLERALADNPEWQAALATAASAMGQSDDAPQVPPQFRVDMQEAQAGEQAYLIRGDREGLNRAVAAWGRILNDPTFAQSDPRFQLAALNDGGGMFLRRYWAMGQLADLNAAIVAFEKTLSTVPPDSPDRASFLNNLGTGLRARYERSGQLGDLQATIERYEQAVAASPPDSPDRALRLNNLGNGLRDRYWHCGQLADLEAAIVACEQAVAAPPPDSPDRASFLNNLGNGLSDRYGRNGQLADLQAAIELTQQAIAALPPDSPDRAGRLNNLGIGLRDRYGRTSQLADLQAAIDSCQQAVAAPPPRFPRPR